jgi:hypothetical protein
MTDSFVNVEGHRVSSLRLIVGNYGPWHAECDFEDAPELGTRVTITAGTLKLQGTVVVPQDGSFGGQRKTRIVAGGAGWGKPVSARAYHNDAGVKARLIAEDAAREVGETLGSFVPVAERVGNDYVRQVGPASRTLEDSIGEGIAWWVDYNGLTQVGPRPGVELNSSSYEVLSYDPRTRIATLAVDDPAAIVVGAELTERLDGLQTVREFELTVDAEAMRVTAWMGGSEGEPGRLAAILRAIIRRATDGTINAKYRYRVVRMAGDGRVELQAVRRVVGLPDILPVSQWPGVAGVHAELAPGAVVLVEFIEGNRTLPIITHYAGKDGTGFVPVSLVIGGPDGPPAARSGDAVEVLLPPAVFSGTIGGTPASGVLTFPLGKTSGTITAGSGKVKVAT